jgi:hypothetical protein
MSKFFRIVVDEPALTDELFAFVTDPRASRNQRPVVEELQELFPDMIPVLEHMVVDGVDERHHVADYVQAAIGHARLAVQPNWT